MTRRSPFWEIPRTKKSPFRQSAPYFRSREFFVFFHTTLQKNFFMGLKSKFER
ncbi:hypothetical protein DESPIG_01272 [Desulfovibrio piger ATCC 29098]|uniref:Uncharacterized protein n=1 Tax=Desulfovibrio piger ATCC 29098 TaxID=411464 RepID=B6WT67_9BACT|nr:hypothetical protein DESPIG_01272 [Desulfovibrio piger ATCC 29098]